VAKPITYAATVIIALSCRDHSIIYISIASANITSCYYPLYLKLLFT